MSQIENTYFDVLPDEIAQSKLINTKKKTLLAYLLYRANAEFSKTNGYFFDTNQTISKEVEIAEKNLRQILTYFEDKGWIKRIAGKRKKASEYTVNKAEIYRYFGVGFNGTFEEFRGTLERTPKSTPNNEKVPQTIDLVNMVNALKIRVLELEKEVEELKFRGTLENAEMSKVPQKVPTDTYTHTYTNNIDHNNNTLTESTLQGVMVPVSVVSENLTLQNGEITTAENIIISDSPIEKRNDTTPHGENPNDDNNIDSISNEMDLQGCDTAHNESNPNDDDKTDTTDANPNDMTTTTTQGHSDPTVKRWISIISVLQTDWSQGDDTRRNEILNEVTDIAKQARAIRNEISDDVWCNLNDEMRKLKTLMTDTANTQSKSEGYINNPQPPRPTAYDPTTPKDVNQQSYRYMISACNLIQEGVRNVTKGISDKYARKIQIETVEDKIERMYKICARLTDKQWSIFLQYLNRWDDALDGKQDNRLKPINKDNEGAVNEMLVYVETINHTVSKWKATPDRERYNACEAVEDAKRRVMALRERLTDSQYSVYEEAVAKWNKTYTYNN